MIFVDKVFMLQLFLKEKKFLNDLYRGSSVMNQRILNFAQESSLNVLLRILFLIANGIISIPRDKVETLKRSRKLKYFVSDFDNKASFNILLHSNRENKLKVLRKYANVFDSLLFTMFNDIFKS